MAQLPEGERPKKQEGLSGVREKGLAKKSYVCPSLLEYGSVAKLTQGSTGLLAEGQSGMMASVCL